MNSRPKIFEVKPESLLEKQGGMVTVKGEDFDSASVVHFNGVSIAANHIFDKTDSQFRFYLPQNQVSGVYPLRVTNSDGGFNIFQYELTPIQSAVGRYSLPVVDMMSQPLSPPLQAQTYSQRMQAGLQFEGDLPEKEQGQFLDGQAPTKGGYFKWAEDVIVTMFTLRSNGVEPAPGRTSGSGIFLRQNNGSEVLILDLSSGLATKEYIYFELQTRVQLGEEILIKTVGATKEMIVSLSVKIDRPFI